MVVCFSAGRGGGPGTAALGRAGRAAAPLHLAGALVPPSPWGAVLLCLPLRPLLPGRLREAEDVRVEGRVMKVEAEERP